MRRFFVPPETLLGDEAALPAEVVHHLAVLRLAPGEEILLLDGRGTVCRCRLETLRRNSAQVRILERRQQAETAWPFHLLQALPKGDKFDLILQKGTELGVTAFTPVLTGRSVPRREESREDRRQERWEKIIREAARQCGRSLLPRLNPPLPLAEALHSCREDLRLIFWEGECRPLPAILAGRSPVAAAVLVGPEGGFSPQEVEIARSFEFLPVSLGPRILRTETAGLAVASILQYLFGDLGQAGGRR